MELPDVFVVTLMRDKERVAHVQEVLTPSLQAAEIPRIHVHEAVDGKSDALRQALLSEKVTVDPGYGRKCGVGQLGCYLSHYQVWKRALAAGLDECIIVEDDAVLSTDRQHLMGVVQEAHKFDFVYLFTSPAQHKNDPGVHMPFHDFLNKSYRQYGTVAYMVTRKGMQTLVDELRNIACNVDEAIIKLVASRKLVSASCKVVPFSTVGQLTGYYKGETFRSNVHRTPNASSVIDSVREKAADDEK